MTQFCSNFTNTQKVKLLDTGPNLYHTGHNKQLLESLEYVYGEY